ncbi:hypothetical protein [uncultured phage]|nr:hypothetical protein [uncultured phage]
MNVWQIAEKLFNFCEEKYPDLEWRWNYYSYGDIDGWKEVSSILGSYSLFKLELEICSDKKQEFYEKEATYDYILGRLFVLQSEERSLLPWSGSFTVNLNHNKNSELELMLATHDDWNDDSWSVVKQARKMVREIFNFIEDEIQE